MKNIRLIESMTGPELLEKLHILLSVPSPKLGNMMAVEVIRDELQERADRGQA